MSNMPQIGVKAVVGGMSAFKTDMNQVNQLAKAASGSFNIMAAASAAAFAVLVDGASQIDQINGALAKVAVQTGQARSALGPFRTDMETLFRTGLVDSWQQAADNIELATQKIKGLKAGTAETREFATAAAGVEKAWGASAENVIGGAQAIIEKFPQVTTTINKAASAQTIMATVTTTNAKEAAKLSKEITALQDKMAIYIPTVDKHGQVTAASARAVQMMQARLGQLQSKLAQTTTSHQALVSTVTDADITLSKSYLTGQQALDLLTRTAQESTLPLDQVNQIVMQYGSTFAEAGLSAQDFGGIVVEAGQNGFTNFGKLNTAIATFHKNVSKPPKGFETALAQLGLDEVSFKLRNNQISMSSAIDQIIVKLGEVKTPAEKNALAMTLFGSSIDKNFGPDELEKIAGFSTALDNTKDAADNAAKAMEDDGTLGTAIHKLGNNIQFTIERFAQSLFDWLKTINITQWIQDRAEEIRTSAGRIAAAFSTLWKDATDLWNSTFKSGGQINAAITTWINDRAAEIRNSAGLIAGAFSTLWNDAVSLWNSTFQAGGTINTAVTNMLGSLAEMIRGNAGIVTSAIGELWDGFTTKITDIFQSGGAINTAITNGLQGAAAVIRSGIDTVGGAISAITSNVGTIWDATFGSGGSLSKGVDTAMGLVKDAVDKYGQPVKDLLDKVSDAFTGIQSAADVVAGAISGAMNSIANAINSALGPVIQTVQGLVDAINSLPGMGGGKGGGKGHSLPVPGNPLGPPSARGTNNIPEGFSTVGEQGMELVYKAGGSVSVMPMAPNGGGGGTTVNNTSSSRNFNLTMNGVRNGQDAVARFSMMNAMRKI